MPTGGELRLRFPMAVLTRAVSSAKSTASGGSSKLSADAAVTGKDLLNHRSGPSALFNGPLADSRILRRSPRSIVIAEFR
jgi:hypothetical protein